MEMLLKSLFYLFFSSGGLFCSGKHDLLSDFVDGIMGNICVNFFLM